MYHAFIIDDDKMAIHATFMMFPWKEMNVDKITKICSPSGLTERIMDEKPHIAFIDIEMYEVSGLDIVKECCDLGSETLFVIISGHDDFKYAHTAVNIGVVYYLLKPIDPADVAVVTKRLKNFLDQTSTYKNDLDHYNAADASLEEPPDLWEKITVYIEMHYAQKINAQDICKDLFIGTTTFYALFKKHAGEPFVAYLTRLRIEKAKMLLLNSKKTLAEIAEMVGLDYYYFNKTFKKHIGVTPVTYKKINGVK